MRFKCAIMISSLLALYGCSRETTDLTRSDKPTPFCDRAIEVGSFQSYKRMPLPQADTVEEAVLSYLKLGDETLGVNRTNLGNCVLSMIHFHESPEPTEQQRIRVLLIEPESDTLPSLVAAAGERRLCKGGQGWQQEPCTGE